MSERPLDWFKNVISPHAHIDLHGERSDSVELFKVSDDVSNF